MNRALSGTAIALLAALNVSQVTGSDRYPSATWDAYSNGAVNISVYVFRDINRNGIYDMGDRPMSGILVDARGNRKTMTRRSNMSGFANYAMSASDPDKDITFAGGYEFTVIPPPGWHVTTGNATQTATFELLAGSPADIATQEPPKPVGLAPDLVVRGRVPSGINQIHVAGPQGLEIDVPAEPTGEFRFDASPGEWLIKSIDDKFPALRLVVGDYPVVLPLLTSVSVAEPTEAGEQIEVGFDDLRSTSVFKIPSGYAELGWDNFVMAHEKVYGVPGYRNNIMSGEFVAYNGSGHPAAIFSETPFDFIGGYLGLSNNQGEGETLHVLAWRGDELAYSEDLRLSAFGPIHFAAGFHGITRLEFRTGHYWQATFDDLSFRIAPP